MTSLAERLRDARTIMGKKQAEMAALSGVSERAYQGYEAGRSVPGGDAIEGFMKVGISANWLLTGEGPMLLADLQAPTESSPAARNVTDGSSRGLQPPAPTVTDGVKKSRTERLRERQMEEVRKALHAPPPGHREVAGEGGFFVPDGFDHVPQDDERYPLSLLLEAEDTNKLPDYMTAGPGRTLLPFYPSMTTRLSQALTNVYGASYNKLNEEDQTHLFQKIYGVLCQLGADETAVPRVEEIEAVAKLAIRLGKAPTPAHDVGVKGKAESQDDINRTLMDSGFKDSGKER